MSSNIVIYIYIIQVLGETLNVNGINTQGCQPKSFISYFDPFSPGENVADLGGVKEAIRTYEKIVERFRLQSSNRVKETLSGGVRSRNFLV